METIEMTETQRTGIREVLILKSERLMFSVHMLEMRLKQATAQIQKLAYKIFLIKAQIENLLVKVLFDLPLAVALEKAQLQVLEKFLEDGLIKPLEI